MRWVQGEKLRGICNKWSDEKACKTRVLRIPRGIHEELVAMNQLQEFEYFLKDAPLRIKNEFLTREKRKKRKYFLGLQKRYQKVQRQEEKREKRRR